MEKALISSVAGAALVGVGAFVVPKVEPIVNKVTTAFKEYTKPIMATANRLEDCFTYQQPTRGYFAAVRFPNCFYSPDTGGDSGTSNAGRKVIGSIVKEGSKTTYTNPAGKELKWVDQHPKNINRDIDNALKSSDPGKATEAKVADFIRKEKEVIGFGVKIERLDGNIAGDLYVVTKDEIIEVKASISAIKRKLDQYDKLTNVNDPNFFNPEQKKVILYIDKPLENLGPNDLKMIENIKSKGVTIVNSLDELKEVLK